MANFGCAIRPMPQKTDHYVPEAGTAFILPSPDRPLLTLPTDQLECHYELIMHPPALQNANIVPK